VIALARKLSGIVEKTGMAEPSVVT